MLKNVPLAGLKSVGKNILPPHLVLRRPLESPDKKEATHITDTVVSPVGKCCCPKEG